MSFIKEEKTKIVATIGPATESEEMLTKLTKAGLDVMRLNFSHGDHQEHLGRIVAARKVSKKLGKTVAILQDLAGPKIRIGEFYQERVMLKKGSVFTLTTKNVVGDETKVFVNYRTLPKEVKKGGTILLDDGKKKLEVVGTTADSIKCKVIVGGETKGRRGVNVPGAYLKISSLTAKDKKDLAFGIKQGVDFVALSFVRQPKDVLDLRKILDKEKSDAAIIAKIETQEAVDNIDEIIALADGIMVARGDLAIEVPAEDVPVIQKMIVKKCNELGKPVIVATQMLESMIHSPVPTRAEVSDVANSIFDGTDAIMLSEETTLGEYPLEAVLVMSRIARRVEALAKWHREIMVREDGTQSTVDTISSSAVDVADRVKAKAIVALTESGSTARMVSRFKPTQPIIVMSPNERARTKLSLSYGCYHAPIKGFTSIREVTKTVSVWMANNKLAKKDDKIVIVAGIPFGKTGGTNMVFVHKLS
ncbi:MAG: pyruvate kinase [Candidatus Pacebacteria bacterium]|nr:pyruvate kinase [Candidatus Paceibacterota bacterium]